MYLIKVLYQQYKDHKAIVKRQLNLKIVGQETWADTSQVKINRWFIST